MRKFRLASETFDSLLDDSDFNIDYKEECLKFDPSEYDCKIPINEMYRENKLLNSISLILTAKDDDINNLIQYYKF